MVLFFMATGISCGDPPADPLSASEPEDVARAIAALPEADARRIELVRILQDRPQ